MGYQRRTRRKKKTTVKEDVKKVLSMVKKASPEVKYMDYTAAGGSISQTANPSVYDLFTNVTSGYQITERVGSKIMAKSIDFRFQLVSATASTTDDLVRLIIWRVKKPLGVAQTLSDVVMTSTASINIYSPLVFDQRSTFTVLHDKVYRLVNNQSTTTGKLEQQYHLRFPLKDMPVQYNGNTAGVDVNGVYYTIVGSNSGVSTPTWNHYVRLLYTDA